MTKRVEQSRLLQNLKDVAEELDRPPTSRDIDRNGKVAPENYYNHFESWSEALEMAGINYSSGARHDLLEELRQIYDEINEVPTQGDVQKQGEYSPDAYHREFHSFVIALEMAGLEPTIEQYQGSDLTPPEDKRWTKNVRELKQEGPTKLSELPSSPSPSDKQYGLWKFMLAPDRDHSDRSSIPTPDPVCYLDDEHNPEMVLREFFSANSQLLDQCSERFLINQVRQHRKAWEKVGEDIVPELLQEHDLELGVNKDAGLLLVDCTGHDVWQSCIERTVTTTIDVEEHLSDIDGERYAWGFPEEYEGLWTSMEPGDVVAFATESGEFTHAFRITECIRDWNAGTELWAEYEDEIRIAGPDQPWPFLLLGTSGIDISIPVDDVRELFEADSTTDAVQYVKPETEGVLEDGDSVWSYLQEIESKSKENSDVGRPDGDNTKSSEFGSGGTGSSVETAQVVGKISNAARPDSSEDEKRDSQEQPSTDDSADTYSIDVRLASIADTLDTTLSSTVSSAVREHLKRSIDGDINEVVPLSGAFVAVQLDLDERQQQFLDTVWKSHEDCKRPDDFVNDALRIKLDAPTPEEKGEYTVTIDATTAAAAKAVISDENDSLQSVFEPALVEELASRFDREEYDG